MEYIIGLLIALAISLTGIGGGTLTAPVLMLYLGLPAAEAVGTSLIFVAVVKLFAAPLYVIRRQVNYRILGFLVLGGLPGVVFGSLLLQRMAVSGLTPYVLTLVGLTIVVTSTINLWPKGKAQPVKREEHPRVLAGLAAVIGTEVGFSAAGAGALGTLLLMHLTELAPAQIVGTDLLFGLALSIVGGGLHLSAGALHQALLLKMIAAGIPGALLGSYLSTHLPTRILRQGLSVWLLYLGGQLLTRGVGVLWQSI